MSAIAEDLDVSRTTVRAAIASDWPATYRSSRADELDRLEPRIRQILREDPGTSASRLAEVVEWRGGMTVFRRRVATVRRSAGALDSQVVGVIPSDLDAVEGVEELLRGLRRDRQAKAAQAQRNIQIRDLRDEDPVTHTLTELARRFGLSKSRVVEIVTATPSRVERKASLVRLQLRYARELDDLLARRDRRRRDLAARRAVSSRVWVVRRLLARITEELEAMDIDELLELA